MHNYVCYVKDYIVDENASYVRLLTRKTALDVHFEDCLSKDLTGQKRETPDSVVKELYKLKVLQIVLNEDIEQLLGAIPSIS